MTKDIISNNDSKIRLCKRIIYAYNFPFEGIKFMNNETEHISGANLDTKKDTNRAEGLFHGYHESELYWQSWMLPNPENATRTVLITHGHGEHSESYSHLAQDLNRLGYNVIAWDLRGHGKSFGQRGYVDQFEDYIYDLESFFNFVTKTFSILEEKLVLFGHSMGGLILTNGLIKLNRFQKSSVVLSSPMYSVALKVPLYKQIGSLWVEKFLPKLTLGNEIEDTQLTRDPNYLSEYKTDVFRHDRMSAATYLGAEKASEYILAHAGRFNYRVLVQVSDNDPVVRTQTVKNYFELFGSNDKILKIYKDNKHEIYNDLDRLSVIQDMASFLAG